MQRMIKLTERQKKIWDFISREINVGMSDILDFLKKTGITASRFSIVRDLKVLLKNDFISKIAGGRSTKYTEKSKNPLHRYIDMDDYFKTPQDERMLSSESFEFEIFKKLNNIFTKDDIEKFENLNKKF